MKPDAAPVQPVEKPILCSPYEEPQRPLDLRQGDGRGQPRGIRAGRRGTGTRRRAPVPRSRRLFAEEERDDLPLVNLLREDVRRWREADYRGTPKVTRELLDYWAREDRTRRLFFCQREAVETMIYLAEIRIPADRSRTGFRSSP